MYDGERKNVNPLVYLFTKETFILLVALQIIYKLTNLTSAFFLDHLDPAFTTIKTNFAKTMKESYRPGYVSVKWGYCRVEPLVALYKAVFFNFPDLSVFVPGLQVGLQVRCISHHSYSNGSLDLTDLFILLWNRKRGKHCWSQPTADYFKQYTDNDVNGFFFTQKSQIKILIIN